MDMNITYVIDLYKYLGYTLLAAVIVGVLLYWWAER